MIPTENLYLKYLYSTSKTALRDFLDDLGREAEHAMVVPIDRIDRTDGACRADDDPPGAEVREREARKS